jgi:hypothetical protein
MKVILIMGAIIIFIVVLIGGGLFIFKGDDILNRGTEKALLVVQSQVEDALPANYSVDEVRKKFDVVLEKVKTGEVNTGELTALLTWIPARLQDGKLDSVEVDSVIQRLNKAVTTK